MRSGLPISSCPPCGGKLSYLTRKAARQAARRLDRSLRAYPCLHQAGIWHNGHLPEAVRHGEIDRDKYREHMS